MKIAFDNTYAKLPPQMFTAQLPVPVKDPQIIATNAELAKLLGINPMAFQDLTAAKIFAGNHIPDGAAPLAQVYAGHQFGNWNPQLGDGRAILLGEVIGTDGIRRDIQLKGSGPTPYSRRGDGRAWLGPVMREYIISEAMHAMGVPTTRALAAVTTGEPVYREEVLPGAVITRVAQSHIRVGTFQFFASRGDMEALQALTDHVIARHYPDATGPADLLDSVIARYARLIARWMSLGFIHGVMNTDNVSIAGETIDYGPCAFMDAFHPDTVFSAIDQYGRYAYSNQPGIGAWNMAQFATALIPLMPDRDKAIEDFTAAVHRFPEHYEAAWLEAFGRKLGIMDADEDDRTLIADLLDMMTKDGADFTNVFANLGTDTARDQFIDRDAFDAWALRWNTRKSPDAAAIMAKANPQIIPRNHRVEEAITAGRSGNLEPFHALLAAVTQPYAPLTDETARFARAPSKEERVTRTFCGT
ncbi:protein adenylyltransferase SelO [Cognatiyoonia sp. IB215182]|uniref:protein adenylyltransferase SelO n=1 Tax=Cognatiyoonia sp. IB215182 TaxID=3097353 RepID=UPI002A0CE643|nr:YdiU family protein [Cognatiyoonia sp. IB215182]MDX8352193.1 YdiU family protein [Cognatiyoonia sp. IB215182]